MIDSRSVNPPPEQVSALPIWTVTLGVFALLTFGLTAVPSIICGHLARARATGRCAFEKSVTNVGLAIGYLGTAILAIWIAVLVQYLLR
jgi:hypothetical protein